MNFDDQFTKDFEEKFQKNLQAVRGVSPEDFEKIKQNLQFVFEFLEDLKNKPDKTPEDFEHLEAISSALNPLSQELADMKLVLDESLYRQSIAYYEHVKKLTKEGNIEAEKIYLDLKPHFETFDPN
ncbi:hypothetical protein ASG01_10920 [Chryseobacterium sp. Leaf180]|uniref:hypothetical protein n=1 Tax=Chryseobacterium sp. Leaf180 TaxID=1736289 RepID=UPI0007009B50|nr:hypothetical protein [Chryseobacterium sp. Leaf180]KQR92429.1 hypothetical protein ASG01_10920 [Chryseobacterium sp. Leaf180]